MKKFIAVSVKVMLSFEPIILATLFEVRKMHDNTSEKQRLTSVLLKAVNCLVRSKRYSWTEQISKPQHPVKNNAQIAIT